MSSSTHELLFSTLVRARFLAGLVPCLLLATACGDSGDGGATGGVGSGVANTGSGAAAAAGAAPSTGGSAVGDGDGDGDGTSSGGTGAGAGTGTGSDTSTGGGSSGGSTGGVFNAGGTFTGDGGADPGTGGAAEPATCEGEFAANPVDGAVHSVTVENASDWGELPHFWNTYGTGHLGLYLREDRSWGETLKAHTLDGIENLGLTSLRQHGLFHDDIGIYSEVDGEPVYDFTKSDEIFDFFVENGIEPIVELAPMPSDLAADPSATVFDWDMVISPPKDYERWQELVRRFVEHSIENYGEDVVSKWYFEVWNEPECCSNKFWDGTLQEYHQLYDYAAAGVRAALPGGRVGGPVASQPRELTSLSNTGTLFLDHVTQDNYVTPGSPGILDFFSYHSWSFIDGAVGGYFEGLELLDSYGLTDIGIAITEFGPTYEFFLPEEPQEMSQGAAFVAQTYSDISQRCAIEGKRFPITYSWWVLSDVFEEGLYFEDDPFIGCMGLISRENIRKPAYNAYKFLADMGNTQIALFAEGPGDVGGMASRDAQGGIQILLYNGQNPGLGPQDDTYYAVTEAQEIGITLTGLNPDQPYDVTAYRVDDVRGNAYAAWENQGRPTRAEMSEANWQELRDNMDSPAEPLGQALCGDTFTQSLAIPSPGVLFVTLTPTAP